MFQHRSEPGWEDHPRSPWWWEDPAVTARRPTTKMACRNRPGRRTPSRHPSKARFQEEDGEAASKTQGDPVPFQVLQCQGLILVGNVRGAAAAAAETYGSHDSTLATSRLDPCK